MVVILENGPWMVWNLLLAAVPFVLAVALFARDPHTRLRRRWLPILGMFVAFLPNAPYVITDLKHLPGDLATVHGDTPASVALLIEYGMLVALGVAAYVVCLALVRRFLLDRGWQPRAVLATELALHLLCALGVLLGRVPRFNSWDLASRPHEVAGVLLNKAERPASWAALMLMFGGLVALTLVIRGMGRGLAVVRRVDRW